MIPKRRKPPKMGLKQSSMIRSESHKRWVRGFECAAGSKIDACEGRIESAHARKGTDGGTGMDPSDCWVIPLCAHHHKTVQHTIGEPEFERRYGIDMKAIAKALWDKSPHKHKVQS